MSTAEGRRIALGSAQFGQRYGVANRSGMPVQHEVDRIVAHARANGVDTIDTAIAYGESEAMLGVAGVEGLRVVTKLPPLPVQTRDAERWVRREIEASMRRLGVRALHGVLLHRPADAFGDDAPAKAVRSALGALKREGFVAKVGASVYEAQELSQLTDAMDVDLVQLPYNVLDRRFDESGWMERLNAAGVEIHVRSVFLQGLLLLDEREMPPQFLVFRSTWTLWRDWLRAHGLSPVAAALGFAIANPAVDHVVVGVESLSQLKEILVHASSPIGDVPRDLRSDDLALINPVNWARA